jgi:mRNA-degrading endonuclease RelE of RelBE toxin-antitoxin system
LEMRVPSKIQFADEKVKKAFLELENAKGDEKQLYEFLERAFNDIEENAFCGIQIPKKQIPKDYVKKYRVKNLWKYNLPNAWRLIYSIESNQILVISIVLEWMDHKNYERKFSY